MHRAPISRPLRHSLDPVVGHTWVVVVVASISSVMSIVCLEVLFRFLVPLNASPSSPDGDGPPKAKARSRLALSASPKVPHTPKASALAHGAAGKSAGGGGSPPEGTDAVRGGGSGLAQVREAIQAAVVREDYEAAAELQEKSLGLMREEIQAAVLREDYDAAAELKTEADALRERLTGHLNP